MSVEFDGHQLYKIENNWLFDLTTFIGYHVKLDESKQNVIGYTKAFIAIKSDDSDTYSFDKIIDIPIRILRKVTCIIQQYRREALLEK